MTIGCSAAEAAVSPEDNRQGDKPSANEISKAVQHHGSLVCAIKPERFSNIIRASARHSPDSIVKQPSAIARILCGAGYAVFPPRLRGTFLCPPAAGVRGVAPAKAEGTERREARPYPVVPRSLSRARAPLGAPSRLRVFGIRRKTQGAGSALPGTRLSRSPSPASSSRRAPSGPRAESRASRVQGYEPCPRAPRPPPPSERLMRTPSVSGRMKPI